MYLDMMPHVVSTLGWLLDPVVRSFYRALLLLPDTPNVVKLHRFLKNPPPFVFHVL
jgi:hypothetical protein